MIDFDEDKQNKRVTDLRKQEEERLAERMANRLGLKYLDLTVVPIDIDALRYVSELEAREASLAVFNVVDKNVDVGVLSPENIQSQNIIKRLQEKGNHVEVYMVSHTSLEKVWSRYKDLSFSFETKGGALDISNEQITDFLASVHTTADVATLINEVLSLKKAYRISRILEIILAGAIAVKASDVHLEPEENYVRLRYRLDGMLTNIIDFDLDTFKLLLSRIKLISNLKLNIGSAQDGRFSIKLSNEEIEIRTSLLPGAYSDSVVLRVLNPQSIAVGLQELGINEHLLKILMHEIGKPNGMILNTGPTGSGKTTTLYAFLKKVHEPGIKIITIENPIEYHLPGIVQTQTDEKKNYTFNEGLRSALRQDPDIIMVGEIRDKETAETSINAALTGHLVFSTLHTNNAAGTFPRLVDLGMNPKTLSSAINIAMAQRLVRRLCNDCKKEIDIDEVSKKIIDEVLESIYDKSQIENLQKIKMFEATSCIKCNNTGYKGRIGIHEAIKMDDEIEKVINTNLSEREIRKASLTQGILDLKQDGVIKVLQGITTLDELSRVVDMEN
ncbi:MAG: GspE/PulE family protein [Minisyncoccota bacterium]